MILSYVLLYRWSNHIGKLIILSERTSRNWITELYLRSKLKYSNITGMDVLYLYGILS